MLLAHDDDDDDDDISNQTAQFSKMIFAFTFPLIHKFHGLDFVLIKKRSKNIQPIQCEY